MSKHTKGPWSVKPDLREDDEPYGWDITADDSPVVGCEGIEAWFPNAKANAYLIAAAPDLLESAERIDKLSLVISSSVRRCDPEFNDRVCAAVLDLRAAIAKARGEP